MSDIELPDPYPHFEEDFQGFMHGGFQKVFVEEWERFYAQQKKNKRECPHGKTPLTCSDCYFHGNK